MNDLKETIRQFILSSYLADEPSHSLRNDTPLQTSGILDSLAVLQVAAFLEARFGVELDVYDTGIERFNRVDDIAACVAKKRAPQTHQAERRTP
jgi:acyl carrier protein